MTVSNNARDRQAGSRAPTSPRSNPSRLVALDGLRGIAALMVVFYHTLGKPRGGHIGIDLFFALSGFLISGQLFEEARQTGTVRLRRFYGRRMLRLLPPFVLLYGLYCLLHLVAPGEIALLDPLRLPGLLLLTNVHIVQGSFRLNYLRHIWTLSVEWQFYIVWPLLLAALVALRFAERQIAGLAVLLTAAIWIGRWYGYAAFRFDGLLLGSAAAVTIRSDRLRSLLKSRSAGYGLLATIVAFAVICATLRVGTPPLERYGLDAVSLLAVVVVLCAAESRLRWFDCLLSGRLLVHIGRISYGLYLYHGPLGGMAFVHLPGGTQRLVGVLLVALPLADCSWRYIERPLIGLGHRLFAPADAVNPHRLPTRVAEAGGWTPP